MSRFLGGVAALLLFVASAFAGNLPPYSDAAFERAAASGKPFVVHSHAVWCTTCRSQERTISRLMTEPAFSSLVVLQADTSRHKAFLRAINVPTRAIVVVFRGKAEIGRLTWETSEKGIRSFLMEKAVVLN